MPNNYFQFKQFIIQQQHCAMKVTTDTCLFGAWCAKEIRSKMNEVQSMKYERGNKKEEKETIRLLDIGTGTGLLALMVAQKNNCLIDAVEIDDAAAAQASENFNASPWVKNISIHTEDILNFLPQQPYDVIISNPPFYEKEIISADDKKNTAHHSHQLHLLQVFSFIKANLSASGHFYLLLPFKRKKEVLALLAQQEFYLQKLINVSPTAAHAPFRLLLKGTRQPGSLVEEKLYITDEQKLFTPEFKTLLKDYYLNL